MKKFLFILLLAIAPAATFAQQINVEAIKADTTMIWGEGTGMSVEEADEAALQDLLQKISLKISSYTNSSAVENTVNGSHQSSSKFESVIETYSHASLTNTHKHTISMDPDAQVIRWMKRSEIDQMFERRIYKITDMVESAGKKIEDKKIDLALKNYYWAYLLLQTLPEPDAVEYTVPGDSVARLLSVYIPEKINEIFSSLNAQVIERDNDDNSMQLFFTYSKEKEPVSSLDYTYFDGQNKSALYSARDGKGMLEMAPGDKSSSIQLYFEYRYFDQRHIDEEIESIFKIRSMNKKTFPNKLVISSGIKKAPKIEMANLITTESIKTSIAASKTLESTSEAFRSTPAPIQGLSKDAEYQKIIKGLLKAIEKKEYASAENLFTPEGAEIFKQLLTYGNAKIVGEPDYKFYSNGDEVIGRGGQMAFSFKNGLRKSFVEDVVFTFNQEQKISNISFGLGQKATEDILHMGNWNEKARITMMEFLENYKTAYALKRLDYIETIFDDDAVIITGKRVHVAPKTSPNQEVVLTTKGAETIKYNRMTKDQFLRHLKMCFDGKEFINIRFSENRVRKMATGGELYAIEIEQDYYSSNYGDHGYLFLMVDINNPKQPIIKVRTWQPEKDPKFGLYGPGDFQ